MQALLPNNLAYVLLQQAALQPSYRHLTTLNNNNNDTFASILQL